jgi:hypothetical protein
MTCRLPHAGDLHALLRAVRNSPIVARLRVRLFCASEWARIRKSADVDEYVLAWIASHVHHRSHRHLM